MPASATDPRQSMLPTQKPKKVWQAGAAPAQAQAAEDWEEELDRELKFFTDGMEELQGSGWEGDDVQGLQGTLGPQASVGLIIPTTVANFDAPSVEGLPNSKKNANALDRMASNAKANFEESQKELIKLLQDAKIPDVTDTNLTNQMIVQGFTSPTVRTDKLVIKKKAFQYQSDLFYNTVFSKLKELKDKLQPLYTNSNGYEESNRTTPGSWYYRNCVAKYFDFQTFFNSKNQELLDELKDGATNYEEFCKKFDMASEITKLQTNFDDEIKKGPPPQPAGAAGPDPSAASGNPPSPAASTAAPQPPPPQPAASTPPTAPQPATAQPTVSPYPVPPSGAGKNGTIDKYFSGEFDFMPDLDSYRTFKQSKKINPGSPEAISHVEEWIKFYDESLIRFQSDLDDYKINGKSNSDFENKKKIFYGNLFICSLFREFFTVVYRIQNQIKPFYEKFKEKQFEVNSRESEEYEKLCIASQHVVDFCLNIERKVVVELLTHDPVLTEDNLYDDKKKHLLLNNYEFFEQELKALSPSPPGPAGGSGQPPQAQTDPPAASSVPPKPGVGGADVSETVLFDPKFYFLPEEPFLSKGIESAPGSQRRIDNAKTWLQFYVNIAGKMAKLERQVRAKPTDPDFAPKLNTVLNNSRVCQIFQSFFQGLLKLHERIKPFYDKIQSQKFDTQTAEFAQYKKIVEIFNDILTLFNNAKSQVSTELKKPSPKIKNDTVFPEQSKLKYNELEQTLIDLTKSAYPNQSSPPKQTSQQSSSSRSDKPSSSSSPDESVTTFSRRSARPDPTDVAELRELLEKTREWGMQMRAAAQENYRIAQKVREFFGPGYEFGEPNKKEPGYDDPPYV